MECVAATFWPAPRAVEFAGTVRKSAEIGLFVRHAAGLGGGIKRPRKGSSIIGIGSVITELVSACAWRITLPEIWPLRALCVATMHPTITVTIRATRTTTLLLVRQESDETMIARLGPPTWAHRHALLTMLEGLALWFQSRLHVVLCAANEEVASSTGLVDGLGLGLSTLHFDVVRQAEPRRGRRLRGVRGISELRRDTRRGSP